MLENIIVILLVIGLSYLFRQNSNDTFNSQMLFILLTLGGIIFYKIIYLQNCVNNKEMFIVDKEPFQNNLNSVLNTFTSGSVANSKTNDYEANKDKINTLEKMFIDLQNKYNDLEKQQEISGDNSILASDMTSMSMNELHKLEKEINSLTEVAVDNKKKDYKKIPVYNSCIIAEANGDKTKNWGPDHTHPKEEITGEDKATIEANAKYVEDKTVLLAKYEQLIEKMKPGISKIFEGTANIEFK
jgi:hypothetical protein